MLAAGSCNTATAVVKYSGGLVANTIFTTTEKQTLRRFRSGGESAHRSLNGIGWRHTVEYGSLKLALILWLFWEPHDLVWEIISVSEKIMKK